MNNSTRQKTVGADGGTPTKRFAIQFHGKTSTDNYYLAIGPCVRYREVDTYRFIFFLILGENNSQVVFIVILSL